MESEPFQKRSFKTIFQLFIVHRNQCAKTTAEQSVLSIG